MQEQEHIESKDKSLALIKQTSKQRKTLAGRHDFSSLMVRQKHQNQGKIKNIDFSIHEHLSTVYITIQLVKI